MAIHIMLSHEDENVLDTNYFVEQLTRRWAGTVIHIINVPNAPILEFRKEDRFGFVGRFTGNGVWYHTYGARKEDAEFALWYCSILPSHWTLHVYDSELTFHPFFITTAVTEQELLGGFSIPFDGAKYE